MTINETHVFNQALVNEVRAGFNRISITFVPQTLVDTTALGINVGQTTMPIALPDITISGPGLRFGGPGGFPSGREVTTFALGDTATWLRGNHIVKFGGEVRRVKHYNFNQDPGSFTYPSVAAFQQGFGSAFAITLGTRAYNAYVNAVGGFVQDSISLGSNLKLDLGLRYDYLPSPTEQDNKLVTFDPATASLLQIGNGGFTQVTKNGSDFQPRVGVIWNPTANGKTVVRGAYAIMVNQSNTGYFTGETGNPPIVSPFSGQASGTAASNIRLDNALTGASLVPVPYVGAAPAIAALRGGHIEGAVLSLGALSAHLKSGAFRGVVASSRLPEFGDIPTMRELGYQEDLFGIWFSLLAPAGVSEDARRALVGAIEQAVQAPAVTARLAPLGILQSYETPEKTAAEVRAEHKRVGEIARKAGLVK